MNITREQELILIDLGLKQLISGLTTSTQAHRRKIKYILKEESQKPLKKFSIKQRKEISNRMKKYWKERNGNKS